MVALSALVSRLRQPDLARPYRMPLWPLPPLVALAGVTVTASPQTGRDLAIVAVLLAAGLLYDVAYLRPRRATHWILLDPLVGGRVVGGGAELQLHPAACGAPTGRRTAVWVGPAWTAEFVSDGEEQPVTQQMALALFWSGTPDCCVS